MVLSQIILLLLIVLVFILHGIFWTIKSTYPEKLSNIDDTNYHVIFGVIEVALLFIYIYIAYIRGKQTDEEENNRDETDINSQTHSDLDQGESSNKEHVYENSPKNRFNIKERFGDLKGSVNKVLKYGSNNIKFPYSQIGATPI